MPRRRLGLIVALLVLPGASWGQDKAKADIVTHTDLVYGKGGDEDLQLDLALPKDVKDKAPAILCVHGGGWRAGNRKDLTKLIQFFAEKGFVAATASYRLSPKHQFPAAIEDCKAAVRWLRAQADVYRIDSERIGAIGFSAGGHLVCLMGTADAKAGLEGKGGHPEKSSRVQAVVSFFGPTDFTMKHWDKSVEDFFLVPFFGGSYEERKELYAKGSPLRYVHAECPPFLFFHGDKDRLVNIEESQKLCKKLKDVGGSARVVALENEGHGWSGEKMMRSLDECRVFFEEKLKK